MEQLLPLTSCNRNHLCRLLVHLNRTSARTRNARSEHRERQQLVHVVENALRRLHDQLKFGKRDVPLSVDIDEAEGERLFVTTQDLTNQLLVVCSPRQDVKTANILLERDGIVLARVESIEQQIGERSLADESK